MRTRSLGPGYGREELIARIKTAKTMERTEPFVVYGDVQAIRLLMIRKRQKNKDFHLTPFQRHFYYRWRNTCFIRRPELKDAWKYKKDVVRLKELSEYITYLLDRDIGSLDDLAERRAGLETERKAAGTAFNFAKRKLYRNPMFALVRERKRLIENREENRERIRELENQIQEHMPLEKALNQYMEAQQEYDKCRLHLKEIRRETKLVDGISREAEKERQQTASVPGDEKKQKGIERIRDVQERRL